MPTPKVVVFDLGKVLVDFDYSIAARRLAAACKAPIDVPHFFAEHAPLFFRYEVGSLTAAQFFQEMCALTGFAGIERDFRDCFDMFEPIQPMIDLHAALRRGYPTYIFSN